MATIDQNLQQIREAVYGEEVRGSIVGAIEQCYADANDVVKVSENQPVEENVKLWVKPTSDEIKVPTWEEHQAVAEDADGLKSAIFNYRTDYIFSPNDWSGGQLSNSNMWISNKLYTKGTVLSVDVNIGGSQNETCEVDFYKDNKDGTATYVLACTATGYGLLNVPVNKTFVYDFFVGIKCTNAYYKKVESSPYVSKSISGTTIDMTTLNTKFMHEYQVNMLSVMSDAMSEKNTVSPSEKLSFGSEETILNLTPNRIYYCASLSNVADYGLPAEVEGGYFTLVKMSPYRDGDTKTGYNIYLLFTYTVRKLMYAITPNNASINNIVWIEAQNPAASIQGVDTLLTKAYLDNNNLTVLTLKPNRIYRWNNTITPAKEYGFPAEGYGTLIKLSPYTVTDTTNGYCVCLATITNNSHSDFYYAYMTANQTLANLVWHRMNATEPNAGLKNLGLQNVSIVFIGDSTVEGYGSSDYNGGSIEEHSDHEIPNRTKTWYRNTGNECWVNKMIAYLQSNYSGVTACNNGIGGLNMSQLNGSIDLLAKNDDDSNPDIVILSAGTNNRDSTNLKTSVVEPLQSIITYLIKNNIQPIILTNTPYQKASVNTPQAIQSAILNTCNSMGVRCYPLTSPLNRYFWEHNTDLTSSQDQTKFWHDQLHPGDIGYEIIFELVKEILSV